jgi:hypothetical protein
MSDSDCRSIRRRADEFDAREARPDSPEFAKGFWRFVMPWSEADRTSSSPTRRRGACAAFGRNEEAATVDGAAAKDIPNNNGYDSASWRGLIV